MNSIHILSIMIGKTKKGEAILHFKGVYKGLHVKQIIIVNTSEYQLKMDEEYLVKGWVENYDPSLKAIMCKAITIKDLSLLRGDL